MGLTRLLTGPNRLPAHPVRNNCQWPQQKLRHDKPKTQAFPWHCYLPINTECTLSLTLFKVFLNLFSAKIGKLNIF
jgi:hypothetical protein